MSADVRNDVLVVEVEEKLTSDQWRGQFEAKRECGVSIWGVIPWILEYCVYSHTDVFGCALIRTGCLETGERYREGRERPISHIFINRY